MAFWPASLDASLTQPFNDEMSDIATPSRIYIDPYIIVIFTLKQIVFSQGPTPSLSAILSLPEHNRVMLVPI
jgi:hypothetical protein